MQAPQNKAMQPEQEKTCPHCDGRKYIWKGKVKTSCVHCNATGKVRTGYKTK